MEYSVVNSQTRNRTLCTKHGRRHRQQKRWKICINMNATQNEESTSDGVIFEHHLSSVHKFPFGDPINTSLVAKQNEMKTTSLCSNDTSNELQFRVSLRGTRTRSRRHRIKRQVDTIHMQRHAHTHGAWRIHGERKQPATVHLIAIKLCCFIHIQSRNKSSLLCSVLPI